MRIQSVRLWIVVLLAAFIPAAVEAHVSIWPRESMQAATERYTVRVPTEGKVTTVAAALEVPAGVVVEVVAMPRGWKHDVKRQVGTGKTTRTATSPFAWPPPASIPGHGCTPMGAPARTSR